MSLFTDYQQKIAFDLQKQFGLKNRLAVPRLTKVVINVGLKEAKDDKKVLESAGEQLKVISGQRPKICVAKKSIAGFKLGQGQPIGLMVTLRGKRAYDFLEKLIGITLPRVRDFNGVNPRSFDGQGNYNLGLAEQIVFSEIDFAKIDRVRGLQITICTSSRNDDQARLLLAGLGVPFAKG